MKQLLSVTIFSALLTLLRMASGLIIAKMVAIYTGPSGMAMLGQIQSLTGALNGIVTAPVGSCVVRYTAENRLDGLRACAPWWRASLKWLLVLMAAIIPLTCFTATQLAIWLFNDSDLFWLVVVAAIALPLSATNTLIASVLNGHEAYKRYVTLGMISVLISTLLMLMLTINFKLNGALVSAAVFSALSGLVMLVGVLEQPWFKLRYWCGRVDRKHLQGVGGYVAMALAASICGPVSMVMVRNTLVEYVGWEKAGYWQAVFKISEVYLGVITVAISTYYLPRLSLLKDYALFKKEIISTGGFILITAIFFAGVIFLFRDIALSLMFTELFYPARELFLVQLLGDIAKILGWILAYSMVSSGATKWFVATEFGFAISFVLLTNILVKRFGVDGANLAYLINYSLYSTFLAVNLKNIFESKLRHD